MYLFINNNLIIILFLIINVVYVITFFLLFKKKKLKIKLFFELKLKSLKSKIKFN